VEVIPTVQRHDTADRLCLIRQAGSAAVPGIDRMIGLVRNVRGAADSFANGRIGGPKGTALSRSQAFAA